jgi:hypothetical protein
MPIILNWSKSEMKKNPMRRAIEGDAHERLDLFIIDFLRPALWAQVELQNEILKCGIKGKKMLSLAEYGLTNDYNNWAFSEAYNLVEKFGSSPMPVVTNGQMIDCITKLENGNYKQFCDQADDLAKEAGIEIQSEMGLFRLWDEWRHRHNALIEEYDSLKRESRFGSPLYRPQLPSRWGEKIDPLPEPIVGTH